MIYTGEPMNEMMRYAAEQLIRTGYPVRLLREGGKANAFKNPRNMDLDSLRYWFQQRMFNFGIALGDSLMVADLDSPEAIRFADENGIVSPMVNRTRRGEHRLFYTEKEVSNQIHFNNMKIDLLMHGHIVAPPSVVDGFRYEWRGFVPRKNLPLFPQHLLTETEERTRFVLNDVRYPLRRGNIRNPAAYVMKIESIQHQNGSGALVRAICVLRDCGWSSLEAYSFLVSTWNLRQAKPPWSEEEIRHAVERHFLKGAKV